jgi:hypothetical protein
MQMTGEHHILFDHVGAVSPISVEKAEDINGTWVVTTWGCGCQLSKRIDVPDDGQVLFLCAQSDEGKAS